MDNVWVIEVPCSQSMPNVGHMLKISNHVELEEMLILCPLWNFTGSCGVVCKQGLMVDPTKIAVIVNLEAPRSVKQLHVTLGHTGYYRKFIKAYAQIAALMEKLLKKDATF